MAENFETNPVSLDLCKITIHSLFANCCNIIYYQVNSRQLLKFTTENGEQCNKFCVLVYFSWAWWVQNHPVAMDHSFPQNAEF